MVTINYAFREISCKIVYYGPGLSGKTTNLQYVHDRVPSKSRGDLISLATETDRTLYFDFLPIHVGDIGGFATKFQLYTVPGQVFYNATRKLVLRGVDGIVFVADSQLAKMDENIESLANMYENLKEYEIAPNQIPIVIQYNKRDLPEVVTIEELERTLNPDGHPHVEACAVQGLGVFDTMKRITKMVLEDTKRRTAGVPAAAVEPTAPSVPTSAARSALQSIGADFSPERPVTTSGRRHMVATGVNSGERVVTSGSAAAQAETPRPSPAAVTVTPHPGREMQPTPAKGDGAIGFQRSTRIRRRQRSLLDRLFGWLLGR